MLVTRTCCKMIVTWLITQDGNNIDYIMTVSVLLKQPYNKFLQACYNLLTACFHNLKQALQCEQNLSTACEQTCYNLFACFHNLDQDSGLRA